MGRPAADSWTACIRIRYFSHGFRGSQKSTGKYSPRRTRMSFPDAASLDSLRAECSSTNLLSGVMKGSGWNCVMLPCCGAAAIDGGHIDPIVDNPAPRGGCGGHQPAARARICASSRVRGPLRTFDAGQPTANVHNGPPRHIEGPRTAQRGMHHSRCGIISASEAEKLCLSEVPAASGRVGGTED